MFVYKIIDPTSQFYLLVLSHIKDTEMVLEHSEHYYALNETDPVAKFFFTIWDDVECESSQITPRQFLEINEKSGAGYDLVKNDTKCMNVSNEFEKNIVVPKPRGRAKKTPVAEDPNAPPAEPKAKKAPKPKGKKSAPIEIKDNGKVDFN